MCGLAICKARSVYTSHLCYTRCPHQRMRFWAGRLWAHLSLWQARLPVSGLVAWFSALGSGPLLCRRCLVTVRSPLWFMQIGRQGLVGQERYVITPSLGQRAIASQQRQSRCQDISWTDRLDCIRTRRNTTWYNGIIIPKTQTGFLKRICFLQGTQCVTVSVLVQPVSRAHFYFTSSLVTSCVSLVCTPSTPFVITWFNSTGPRLPASTPPSI